MRENGGRRPGEDKRGRVPRSPPLVLHELNFRRRGARSWGEFAENDGLTLQKGRAIMWRFSKQQEFYSGVELFS